MIRIRMMALKNNPHWPSILFYEVLVLEGHEEEMVELWFL
jgi:hypothetical protein